MPQRCTTNIKYRPSVYCVTEANVNLGLTEHARDLIYVKAVYLEDGSSHKNINVSQMFLLSLTMTCQELHTFCINYHMLRIVQIKLVCVLLLCV